MYLAAASSFPNGLYIATVILFAILTPPTFFVWRKHGIEGFLGYNFVWSVCAVKIVGSILSVVDKHSTGIQTAATILNSMTISPLILAALGIFHEARKARCVKCRGGHDRAFVALLHCIVFAGLALIVVAIVHAVEGSATSADAVELKVGLALLAASWVIICAATFYSLRSSTVGMFPGGIKLLYAVLFSLPFIGVRLIYGILALLLTNPSFATSLAAKVVLGLIPEFATVAIFVAAGIVTRDMWRKDKTLSEASSETDPVEFSEVRFTSYPKTRNPIDVHRQDTTRTDLRRQESTRDYFQQQEPTRGEVQQQESPRGEVQQQESLRGDLERQKSTRGDLHRQVSTRGDLQRQESFRDYFQRQKSMRGNLRRQESTTSNYPQRQESTRGDLRRQDSAASYLQRQKSVRSALQRSESYGGDLQRTQSTRSYLQRSESTHGGLNRQTSHGYRTLVGSGPYI